MKRLNLILKLENLSLALSIASLFLASISILKSRINDQKNESPKILGQIIAKYEKTYDVKFDGDATFEYIIDPTVIGLGGEEDGTKYIKIDPRWFDSQDATHQEMLVFHELTHSIFSHYAHEDGRFANGCPVSIMDSYMSKGNCYKIMYEYYIRELREHFYEAD